MTAIVSARAPGRVNLIGEHLDYNGGLCLPIALDLGTTATVSLAPGGEPHFTSDHEAPGWTAYVTGVLEAMAVREPLTIAISSNLPVGAGLASSAALTCSVALAVEEHLGLGHTLAELLAATISAENDHVGVPTGGMDQTVSLFAEEGTALLLDFATGTRAPVRFDPTVDGIALLVIDTGVRHALVDSAYADRRADCAAAAELLGVEHLALASATAIDRLPGGRLGRRARHVASEQDRVRTFLAAVEARDWQAAGAQLTDSHTSLRDDYEVSCAELDVAVEHALSAGALGARMTGGGFGGCAIALVPVGLLEDVRASVTGGFTDYTWNAPTTFVVGASGGAQVLRS